MPENFHEIFLSGTPGNFTFDVKPDTKELVKSLANFLGLQPELPDWVYTGAALGVQGGTHVVRLHIELTVQICYKNALKTWFLDTKKRYWYTALLFWSCFIDISRHCQQKIPFSNVFLLIDDAAVSKSTAEQCRRQCYVDPGLGWCAQNVLWIPAVLGLEMEQTTLSR